MSVQIHIAGPQGDVQKCSRCSAVLDKKTGPQWREGARVFQERFQGIETLRDVSDSVSAATCVPSEPAVAEEKSSEVSGGAPWNG